MKEKAQPKIEKRATRGVKLGNLSENALAKKSISAAIEHEKPQKKRVAKETEKDLRKHFDKGKAYDEDEDDVADRKNLNLKEQNEDDKFEAILRDYNNQNKKSKKGV